jgi:formyl-CoA transferase
MSVQPASQVLSGYKVLDLTRARSGPTAARQMADWGADVIKIEPAGQTESGDLGRRHGPDFQNLHRNKRSMTLDLKSSEGLAIFNRLAADTDVVIENYRPRVKFRLKIDYETVKEINPGIVYASISGFGQDGPYRDRPGVDQIAQGMGGHMSVTGAPGQGPMRSGAAISDMTAGLLAANGILLALLERGRSGKGQWVQTSLLEAQIFLLDFQAARWLVDRKVPPQTGNDHPTNVPMGTFETADGAINIAPMPHMWAKLCRLMGLEALIEDPDYATFEARTHNRAKLNATIEAVTRERTSEDWIAHLNEGGVCCGPIYTIDQTFADPQVRHLGIAQGVTTPARGRIEVVGQPIHLSRTPSTLTSPAPEYGQHTDDILSELGYSDDRIAGLRDQGVI